MALIDRAIWRYEKRESLGAPLTIELEIWRGAVEGREERGEGRGGIVRFVVMFD